MSTEANHDEIWKQKRELRTHIRSALKSLSDDELQKQSEQVWDRLFALPQYKESESVGIFLSMPKGEIKTDTALFRIIQDGKELYVPRVGTDFEDPDMEMVRVVFEGPSFHETFYKHWERNKWGIPEPPHHPEQCTLAKPGDIDLLIVPGCAFDRAGGRLGQGKGYYDRFIDKMVKGDVKHTLHLVSVGLTPQFIEGDVPTLSHDHPMEVMVSPDFVWVV